MSIILDSIDNMNIHPFKDSLIIKSQDQENMLRFWLNEKHDEAKNFKLLFSADENGISASDFHEKCDNKYPTLTIIKSDNDCIFGGFTFLPWDKSNDYKEDDPTAFVFSLDKKKKFDCNNQNCVIYCHQSNLATFGGGCDIYVGNNNICYTSLGYSYGQGQTRNNCQLLINGNSPTDEGRFKVKEMEVYLVEF